MKTSKKITCRASLTSKRCGRAYGIAQLRVVVGILVAGTVCGYASTTHAGGDFWCVEDALSQGICDPTPAQQQNVITIPGLADFLRIETLGSLIERPGGGTAHFTGKVDKSNDTNVEFDVDWIFSGRLDSGDEGYPPPGSPILDVNEIFCPYDSTTWHYYTAISGTMTGRPGSIYDGAVYSVTLGPIAAQVGDGANNASSFYGLWAPIIVEAIGELPNPNLPTGPMEGVVNLMMRTEGCFPPPIVDVTGTWTGSIECAGYDVDVDTVPQEQLSTNVVLKFGNQHDFSHYNAELTENSTVETFCAQVSNNRERTQDGQGRLISSTGSAPAVFLKVADVDRSSSSNPTGTLRARQIRITLEGGAMLCKWSFTLTDTADPQIANPCP